MKALSLNADFAMLVLLGKKTIECRTWHTNYRGDILICANSKKIKGTIPGHGLCVVKLADIRPFKRSDCKAACMHRLERPEVLLPYNHLICFVVTFCLFKLYFPL